MCVCASPVRIRSPSSRVIILETCSISSGIRYSISEVLSSCRTSPLTCEKENGHINILRVRGGRERERGAHLVPETEVMRVLDLVLGDELADGAKGVEALYEETSQGLERVTRKEGRKGKRSTNFGSAPRETFCLDGVLHVAGGVVDSEGLRFSSSMNLTSSLNLWESNGGCARSLRHGREPAQRRCRDRPFR